MKQLFFPRRANDLFNTKYQTTPYMSNALRTSLIKIATILKMCAKVLPWTFSMLMCLNGVLMRVYYNNKLFLMSLGCVCV